MRELVLVGGGHAHLEALQRLARRPPAATRVRLISDRPTAVYSGMVPGVLERRYQADAATIDLARFAARAGAAFTCARVVEVGAHEVRTAQGDRMPFDVVSLDVGSGPTRTARDGSALSARPGSALVDAFAGRDTPAAHIAVVGGGAAGVEIAFTLVAGRRAQRVTLWERGPRLLPALPLGLGRSVEAWAARRGVDLRLATAFAPEPGGPEAERFDLVIQATGASAPALGRESGLRVDGEGYVRVDESLRVEGAENIFAVGDCATLTHAPDTPRAGVFAVRQGPVLARNLGAILEGRELCTYQPQRRALVLLNLGGGMGAAARGGAHFTGSSMMRLKDWIDHRWMRRFR